MNPNVKNNVREYIKTIQGKMPKAIARGILRATEQTAGEIKRTVKEKFNTRTGGLSAFKSTVGPRGDKFVGVAYNDISYAGIQNWGGIITPKNRKFLAVPISAKAKATVGKGPRDWPDGVLKFIKGRNGHPSRLVEIIGKKNPHVVLHFLLLKSVKIVGKHYLEEASAKVGPQVREILGDEVSAVVTGARG